MIKNSAYRTVSGFPDMEFVDQHNVVVIGVVNMLEKPDFHFSHGGSPTGSFFVLDIEAVPVDGYLVASIISITNCLMFLSLMGCRLYL